jgi:hypothetical protein
LSAAIGSGCAAVTYEIERVHIRDSALLHEYTSATLVVAV